MSDTKKFPFTKYTIEGNISFVCVSYLLSELRIFLVFPDCNFGNYDSTVLTEVPVFRVFVSR
jgi:hypothetical protein